MAALRFALRNLRRDLKSGELAVLLLALLVAVASLTAVGFFTDRIGRAVEQQSGEVLAADLRLESARPIDAGYDEAALRRGLRVARILSMPSVVFHGEASSLVALRAVGEGYPLRGRLKIADEPFGPSRATDAIPGPGEAWADSRLLARLGVPVGATLTVGAHDVKVTQVLDYRPDQGAGFGDLSATLMINLADVPATGLIQPGSRVSRAVLFAGDARDVRAFRDDVRERKKAGERLQAIEDASPQIRASSDRAGRFLSLASLVSVLLSAVAVAMAARRYATRHLDSVALMKCMGASQGFVLRQTLVQLVCVAVIVTVLGTVVGFLAQAGLAWLLRDLIRSELPPPRARHGLARPRHVVDHPGRLRAAAVAAAQARTAGQGPAAQPRAAAAALCRRLRVRDRCGAGVALLAGARWPAGDGRGLGPRRHVCGARPGGLAAGEGAHAAAPRRRRRLALRARQHRAPRPGQRGADRRVRPRAHGAAAARAGARRPARGLAREPAGRRAPTIS